MRAITVAPGQPGSARLEEIAEPAEADGTVLVQMLALGVCGTDREIVRGEYGRAPDGRSRLVLGHESLGQVLDAPADAGLREGDLVVGIVRHADPVPCANCAAGEWDMCSNGLYEEHGIAGLDGFGAERVRLLPQYAVRVEPGLATIGMLVEPASVVAKAWEHIDRIGARATWRPRRVLVTGAGPIGLLAAMMGVQRGYEVHVLDRVREGPKPVLVADLGAAYHVDSVVDACTGADITLECTGVGALVVDVIHNAARNGIVCLTGVASGMRPVTLNVTDLNRELVLENNVVFGTVNANRRHYALAAEALSRADRQWLERLITRRVPLDAWADALAPHPEDVKVVIEMAPARPAGEAKTRVLESRSEHA
jgi:threonine dehydrogenase-like Zn-dependent dehydrogenase